MSALRIQCSPLTKNIYAGRINKDGSGWIGTKVDVTSDVLGAVIQKVGSGNIIEVNANGQPAFEIEVRDIRSPTAALHRAARDLLAALEGIVEMNPELPMGFIEAARAAIAKATGSAL